MPWILSFCTAALVGACNAHSANPIDTGSTTTPPPTTDGHDWPRFGLDQAHSNGSDAPTGITATNLPTLKLQQVTLPGTVDASLIYLHDVQINNAGHDAYFFTTSYGKTLAVDAGNGAILWTFTPSGYDSWAGSARITNSTPVADPGRDFIYAASPDGHVQKLAVADGHMVWSTAITALPTREKIASPLTYSRGRIIAVTGGYIGDAPSYQGHVALLDASTGQLLHTWNSLCSDRLVQIDPSSCAQSGSAIWGRAGAVVDSATGNIFVATGNGLWDGSTNWGDAMLELDPDATHLIANYTPQNTDILDQTDADLGSTSPAILDATHVAQAGKDGRIRVIDLQLSSGSTAHRGGEVQSVSTPGGGAMFTALAVYRHGGSTLLVAADGGGTAAWTFAAGSLTPAWNNGTSGTSPVVAGGLLYVYDARNTIHVYDPLTGSPVGSLNCGGGHWNSPIVADGRVALPEGSANSHSTSGVLDIWRLP
jgi:outer membrane protein assembly factor BamB